MRIAAAIAGTDLSLYLFEGLRWGREHCELHITSDRFDEPTALALANAAQVVVGVHGRGDCGDKVTVGLGGRSTALRAATRTNLVAAGFVAEDAEAGLAGRSRSNICNRGKQGEGLQLEIPSALRKLLVGDAAHLTAFAEAVHNSLGSLGGTP